MMCPLSQAFPDKTVTLPFPDKTVTLPYHKIWKYLFSMYTEVWELESANRGKTIYPYLIKNDYAYGIGLYIVDADSCKKWFLIFCFQTHYFVLKYNVCNQ